MDPYSPIRPIMARCQTTWSAEDFHAAVNVTFHKYESKDYDTAHQDMWRSLPTQFNYLASDLLAHSAGTLPSSLRLLDIGCGTGLATDCILRSPLGPSISHITLLDSSSAMLARARARAESWKRPIETFEGLLEQIPPAQSYDLIITSSVLHHVPDLASFFAALSALQPSGSYFLHIQDPNSDFLDDPVLNERRQSIAPKASWLGRISPKRILNRIRRELDGTQEQNYDTFTIQDLVQQGVTPLPLTPAELYQITDIHVNSGEGISVRHLSTLMQSTYQLVNHRSYGFFGVLESDLDEAHAAVEKAAAARGDRNGFFLGAVWRRL